MIEIGAFEAKTNFSGILAKIMTGEEFIITKRGKPVAKMIGFNEVESRKEKRRSALAAIAEMAKHNTLNLRSGETIKDLINEGRK